MGMRSILPAVLLAAVLGGGCAATVTASTPDLVYAAPGVQVIADYDQPIFYSDGFYWWWSGGIWYRSSYYTGGWVAARPPVAVMRIERPYAYVRYRPAGWAGHPRGAPPQRAASGWRGSPTTAATPGWRGSPPGTPAAQPGWRGSPATNTQPGWRGSPAPAQVRSAPAPAHAPPPPHAHGGGHRR
jgi:hypothetical protein